MDLFSSCYEEVNNYVSFAEQNGQSGQGAKTLSLKMNDYTNSDELRRFALGLSFLVWPFNAGDKATPTASFFAVSAAKRLINTVNESVISRVTHAPGSTTSSKSKSQSKKGSNKKGGKGKKDQQQDNNNNVLNLQLFQEAIGKCNAVFLKAFFTAGIAANARRLIDNCIGSLVTICCALGNREQYSNGSIPWPAFHEAYLQLLDQNPEIAWGFIHEFVVSFQEHGAALPNLTGYTAELINFGINKQAQPINNACSEFARNLDNPSNVLGNLFRSVATFLTISASDLLVSDHDQGGRKRHDAQAQLANFRNVSRSVMNSAAAPLLNFFQVLPESLFNYRNNLPRETYETILQALECARGALNRVSSYDSRGQKLPEDNSITEQNIAYTRAVVMIIGALAPHASGHGDEADAHSARQCACTAMTILTEILDNVDEEGLKQVLGSSMPSANFNNTNDSSVGVWFLRSVLTEWLLLRENDEGYEHILVNKNGGDWQQPDREQDIPFRVGRGGKNGGGGGGGDDDDDDDMFGDDDDEDDDDGKGDIEAEDEGDVGCALLEDGIARGVVRGCVLDLLGALSTVLPDQTAQTVFSICTSTLNNAAQEIANKNNNNANRLAAVAEAAFVAMSEIVEETFHVLRSNSQAMTNLVDAVFSTATFAAFSERPAVLGASIRCAGQIAIACASAASNQPDEDEIQEDPRRALSRNDVDVCVRGALQMLRHLFAVGINSRFKRCQWTALNNLHSYIKDLAISLRDLDDEMEEDEDFKDENNHNNNNNNNNNRPSSSVVVPVEERRSVLFPIEYEEALAQIIFSQDGSNWLPPSQTATSSQQNRFVKLIDAEAIPKIQLMSRALIVSVLRSIIALDVSTAPRLKSQQQILERSRYLFTHRYIDPMMTCIRVGWDNCPRDHLMELAMYTEILTFLRTPLAIPSYDPQSDSFFIYLERYAVGVRDMAINCLRMLETEGNKDKKQQTLFNGIPVDGLIAVIIDVISEWCDGLALGSARLITLNTVTGKNIQTVAKTVNGIHLVNAVSSELVLTAELMSLARTLATSRRGEKRRAAFAILSDFAASCLWWRTMISNESSELVLLPLDDTNQAGTFNLPPPFLNDINPALPTLRPFFKDVLDLACREMYNYANLDDEDVTEENSAAVGNAVWCLCQWLAAACGPAQQSIPVITHALQGNTNPNAKFLEESLPFPPANLAKLVSLLLCASSQSVFRSSLRDNCLMALLRLATMFPQVMGPSSSNHPNVNVKNGNLEEIVNDGFIASAAMPLASLVIPKLTNPTERCETLMRIAALARVSFGANDNEFTAVQVALQQQPIALFALISSVEKNDDPVVIELWKPIVQFLAASGALAKAAGGDMPKSRKAKFLSIFDVRF